MGIPIISDITRQILQQTNEATPQASTPGKALGHAVSRGATPPGLAIADIATTGRVTPADTTGLILQRAMARIEELFAPHLPEGAIKKAVDSGLDTSPEATAKRIVSFAAQLIGRAEATQADLPVSEQRSRLQLFENVRTGMERGFADARAILDALKVLNGAIEETVNTTHDLARQQLSDLASNLGLPASATA